MTPSLTVLMPVRNGAAFVGQAVQSILVQTFRDFEFLIVDDASTDATPQLLARYNDPRIRVVRNDERLKLAGSLNRGMELARGRYIARMDADDIALPSRLAVQVKFMERHADIGICGAWARAFGGGRAQTTAPPAQPEELKAFSLFYCPFSHPSVVMRRELIERHDLRYDVDYYPTEDYELWSRALKCFPCANIPRVLVRYRSHGESMTGSDWANMQEQAGRIHCRQLAALGLPDAAEDGRAHRRVAMAEIEPTLEAVGASESRLLKVVARNRETGIYDAAGLCNIMGFVWFRNCMAAVRAGLPLYRAFAGSPLNAGRRARWYRFVVAMSVLRGKV